MILIYFALVIVTLMLGAKILKLFREPNMSRQSLIALMILWVGISLCLLLASGTVSAKGRYSYLPNPSMTPGVVASTNTEEVCEHGYPERSRHVTQTTIKRVYRNYGVDKNQCEGGCKIDHLIPLSIGGSNDIGNLWPHEYGADRNVFSKTRLEVRLRKEVCLGRIDIEEAQSCIATNWPQCFDRFYPGVYKHE